MSDDKKPLVLGHVGFAPSAAPGDGNANWIKAWRADLARVERERDALRAELAKAQAELERYRATRSFWPLDIREAIAAGDIGAVKAETARAEAQRTEWQQEFRQAQARCAELEAALASIAVLDHGEDCPRRLGCDDSDEGEACAEHEPDGCPECDCTTGMAQTALASDGTKALAAVRLAQRFVEHNQSRTGATELKAALAEAFGSGE